MEHTDDDHYILNIFIFHHFDELSALILPHFLDPARLPSADERARLHMAAAEVLCAQNQTRETTRGAVRQARSGVNTQRTKTTDSTVTESTMAADLPTTVHPLIAVDSSTVARRDVGELTIQPLVPPDAPLMAERPALKRRAVPDESNISLAVGGRTGGGSASNLKRIRVNTEVPA